MSLIRYPGGKQKLAKHIIPILNRLQEKYSLVNYLEPFVGAGAIGIEFLEQNSQIQNAQFNDFDYGIASLHSAILKSPQKLIDLINSYTPKPEDFYSFKRVLENLEKSEEFKDEFDMSAVGFMKMVLHQISFSGLGLKAGSPIGGKEQTGKYKVDCRWSKNLLVEKIKKTHELYSRKEMIITHYSALQEDFYPPYVNYLIYLDPPYFCQGENLYYHAFSKDQHMQLANILRQMDQGNKWILSYDDCPEIRNMYAWAHIIELDTKYSINTIRHNKELLITNENNN